MLGVGPLVVSGGGTLGPGHRRWTTPDHAAGKECVEHPALITPIPIQIHTTEVGGGAQQSGEGSVVQRAINSGEQSSDGVVAVGRLVAQAAHEVVGERLNRYPVARAEIVHKPAVLLPGH